MSGKASKSKTEYARKSFRFMGAKTYNELPVNNAEMNHSTPMNSILSNILPNHP